MSKANRLWAIAIALLAVGATLEYRFHRGPAQNAPSLTGKSLNISAAATEAAHGSNAKSPVGNVEANRPASTNFDKNPLTAEQVAGAEPPVFDRDFAAVAARPYVEAYQRQHPIPNSGVFVWNQFQAVFVRAPDKSNAKGYVVVFFPKSEGLGAGFTCFQVEDDAQDHLVPLAWGYAPNLTHAIENLRRGAVEDNVCFVIL
jgi:hypothetical protein